MTTVQDVAYAVWQDLGKIDAFEEFIATGGSTTTVENGRIGDRSDRPEDNYSIDYTVMVIRSTDAFAPQGEMQRVSAFNSTNFAHTVDTAFTDAVAAGDLVAIANSDIPLREMYRIISRSLVQMGEVPLIDTSLTTEDNKTEYTLPVALKREDLLRVEYQGETGDADDNDWQAVRRWDVIPSTPGATSTLIIPQLISGRTIRLTYVGTHPAVTTFSSTISEYIHPAVVIASATKMALRWLNGTTGGGDNYWLQRENEAAQDYEALLRKHPIWLPNSTPKYYTFYPTGRSKQSFDPITGAY